MASKSSFRVYKSMPGVLVPESTQKGVWMEAGPDEHVLLFTVAIGPVDLAKSQEVPLGACLGIPSLRVVGLPEPHNPIHNKILDILGVHHDPAEPVFGCSGLLTAIKEGDVLVYRGDGADLTQETIEVLWAYVNEELNELYRIPFKKMAGEEVTQEEVDWIMAKLKPGPFAEFFNKYRKRKMKTDPTWGDVECPVEIPRKYGLEVCGACGSKEGESNGGGALMQCSKCKKQKYCSKACQATDWKEHKVICKAV